MYLTMLQYGTLDDSSDIWLTKEVIGLLVDPLSPIPRVPLLPFHIELEGWTFLNSLPIIPASPLFHLFTYYL